MKIINIFLFFLFTLNIFSSDKIQIAIQPYDNFDKKFIEEIKTGIEKLYNAEVTVLEKEDIPKESYYKQRNRYRAEIILKYLDKNTDKKYAKHCGGGNTNCIGLSALGMADFNLKDKQTKYPLTKIQVEAFCKLAAELCIKYAIKVSPETVFTHFEFGLKHTNTTSYGKIDFTYLPFLPNLDKYKIGDFLRNKISWYIIQIKKENAKA